MMEDLEEIIKREFEAIGVSYPNRRKKTCFGKARTFKSLTKCELLYLILTTVSLATSVIITIERMVNKIPQGSADFSYAILLLLNAVFCGYYLVNGLFFERLYELVVLVATTVVMLIYFIFNYTVSARNTLTLVRLILASVIAPYLVVYGLILIRKYHKSKHLIILTVGALKADQILCHNMFVFFAFLKADFQVSLSMAAIIITNGLYWHVQDIVLLPIVIVLSFVSAIIGYLSVRMENRKFVWAYTGMSWLLPAYAVYRIVRSAIELNDTNPDPAADVSLYIVTFICASLFIVIRIGGMVFYWRKIVTSFGKKLKEKVYSNREAAYENLRETPKIQPHIQHETGTDTSI